MKEKDGENSTRKANFFCDSNCATTTEKIEIIRQTIKDDQRADGTLPRIDSFDSVKPFTSNLKKIKEFIFSLELT